MGYTTQTEAEIFCNIFNAIPNGGKRAIWSCVCPGRYQVEFV